MKNTTGILSILFVLIGFAILGAPTKTEAGFSWYVGIGIGGGNGYYGSPYSSYSPYYNGYGSYGSYYNPYGYNDAYGYYYKPVYADYSSRGVYNNFLIILLRLINCECFNSKGITCNSHNVFIYFFEFII
ncbi:hypothetical protein K8Q96_00270 [Candidatus Nomurabacteria bacterium]|nr:hypothetical protein [Candidatus Nomurabacteria bacterium]